MTLLEEQILEVCHNMVKVEDKPDLSKLGNVDFLKEGKFILCSKCLDNTPHIPAWGICQRCGTQYTTSLKV